MAMAQGIGTFSKVYSDSAFSKDFRFRSLPSFSTFNALTNITAGDQNLAAPPGTTAQRPTVPSGKVIIRYNTDSASLEVGISNQTWRTLGMSSLQITDTSSIPNFYLKVRSLFSAQAPLQYNAVTGQLLIPQASSGQAGYLASADWVTFNSKLSDPGANGLLARTAAGTLAARQFVAASPNISLVNPNGVSGNPSIDLNDTLTLRQISLSAIPSEATYADSSLTIDRTTGLLQYKRINITGTNLFTTDLSQSADRSHNSKGFSFTIDSLNALKFNAYGTVNNRKTSSYLSLVPNSNIFNPIELIYYKDKVGGSTGDSLSNGFYVQNTPTSTFVYSSDNSKSQRSRLYLTPTDAILESDTNTSNPTDFSNIIVRPHYVQIHAYDSLLINGLTPVADADSVLVPIFSRNESAGNRRTYKVGIMPKPSGGGLFGITDVTTPQDRSVNMNQHSLTIDSSSNIDITGYMSGNGGRLVLSNAAWLSSFNSVSQTGIAIFPDYISVSALSSSMPARVVLPSSDSLKVAIPSSIAAWQNDTLKAVSIADLSTLVGSAPALRNSISDSLLYALQSMLIPSRIEVINSSDTAQYQNDDLIGAQIMMLAIEGYQVGFIPRSTSVYAAFDSETGTITLTNGKFGADDLIIIVYRTPPVFLLDGSGKPVRDTNGDFIILN